MKLLTDLGKGSHTRSKRQTWDLLQKKSVDGTVKWNPWSRVIELGMDTGGIMVPLCLFMHTYEIFDAENYWKTKKRERERNVCFKHIQTMVSDFPE